MTFIPIPNPLPVTQQDGSFGQLDAFQRLRVSNPTTLFFSGHEYDEQPLLWDDTVTASGTVTHDANNSAVNLNVTTASGDKAVHRTIDYFRYQPGKSQLVFCTFQMAAAEAGLEQRVGYFDDNNGIFLEVDDTTVRLVQRSKASGSVVDTEVSQASWNQDALDGNGASGITLDLTDSQILVIDLQWLGVGRVRVGFDIGGIVVWAHFFDWANASTGVYMTTANLPICYEIETTAIIGGAQTLKAICAAVSSEGGTDVNRGYPFSQDSGSTLATVGASAEAYILSIRPKATFNSITNHGQVILQQVNAFALGQPCLAKVYYDVSSFTGASWTSVHTESQVEYDTSASAFSATHIISQFYVPAATAAGNNAIAASAARGVGSLLPITVDPDGNQIALTVTLTNLTASATTGAVALDWLELR